MLRSLEIGSVVSQPNLILAPMSGVTNSCFRRLIREENPGAVGLVVTEFVSIEGLTRGNERTFQMITFRPEEEPISIQIFGHDIDRMVAAAKIVEQQGAQIVDINSGCPVPKVVKRGGGCELMRQPVHMQKMLREVVKAVSIPVTLKIRSGWDESSINALEIAKIAEGEGVQMLAVHGRTRKQLYRGESDWGILEEISHNVSIPVVGSGDIVDAASAKKGFSRGVAGLMIGRGAMENPWVFSEILSGIENDSTQDSMIDARAIRPFSDIPRVLLKYADLLVEDVGERGAVGRMKQFISQVTRKMPGSAALRRELCSKSDLPSMRSRLEEVMDQLLESESHGSCLTTRADIREVSQEISSIIENPSTTFVNPEVSSV